MSFQTEFEFTLPRGYMDSTGELHKNGVMRLATAADEILPMKDHKVQQNPSYLTITLLSRVVTRLGSISPVNTTDIEGLYTKDLDFLRDLYARINESGSSSIKVTCPKCQYEHEVETALEGE